MKGNPLLLTASAVASLAALLVAYGPASAALVSDNFETDTSSNYTVVDSNSPTDGSTTFAYDYVTAGIPLAPHSALGDTGGLRITVNDTSPAATEAITAFNNTVINSANYRLSVDVYLGISGTSGTTEHAHVGVAGDGATFNQLFSPISGSGYYLAFDGDGGSSSDWRHFVAPNPVNTGDASYLNSTNTTDGGGDTYQALFPSGSTYAAGSPGNIWTTLTIDVSGGMVTYSVTPAGGGPSVPIIRTPASISTNGKVSLGYADLFTSVASPFQSQFVVYDNLTVEQIPEPATFSLLALGLVGFALRRRR